MEVRPPVPRTEVSSEDDRFRCVPYGSVLFARACVARQEMLGRPRDQRHGDYVYCGECTDGPALRTRLGTLIPAAQLTERAKMNKPRIRKRRPLAPKGDAFAPSKATRAAVAALSTVLPQKPPRASLPLAAPEPRAPIIPGLPAPPTPTCSPCAPPSSPALVEPVLHFEIEGPALGLQNIEAGLRDVGERTRQLLMAARAARARLAARP